MAVPSGQYKHTRPNASKSSGPITSLALVPEYTAFNTRRDTHGKYKCNEEPETATIDGGKFKLPTASRACTVFNDRRDSHDNCPHLDASSVDNRRNPKGVRQQVRNN